MRIYEAVETMEQASAREVLAELAEIKDELVTRLIRHDSLTTVDVLRLQNRVNELSNDVLSGRLVEIFTRYQKWSFDSGVEEIDAYLRGEDVASVLKLPDPIAPLLETYGASRIVSIAPEYLKAIADKITLTFVGQRTPQQVAEEIMREYNRAAWQAETIVRTEIGTLQNQGTESRMQQAGTRGKEIGIKMNRIWLHSSGAVEGFARGMRRAKYDPRMHHKAMHGVMVEMDELFTLTNPQTAETWHIDGPHADPLPAGEVVNCYCKRALRIVQ
jgi:hypothetical protein